MLSYIPGIDLIFFDSNFTVLLAAGMEMQKYNFQPNKITGNNLKEYFTAPPFDFIENICTSVINGNRHSFEKEYLGETYLLEGIPISMNNETFGLVTVQNYTQRKKNELSIKLSEEKYRRLFENSFDAILTIDANDNKICDVNQASCELLELNLHEIKGKKLKQVMQFKDNVQLDNVLSKVSEVEIQLLNNKSKTVRIKTSLAKIDEKEYIYMLLQNITDQINAENETVKFADDLRESKIRLEEQAFELIETNETLLELNEKLGKMIENNNVYVAIATHDLKNPLAAVMGCLDLLSAYGDTIEPEDRNKLINSAKGAIDQAFALISDILEINALEEGKARVTVVDCLAEDVISQTIDNIKPLANNKSIEIILNVDAQNTQLRIDRERLDRILQNLLSNAIKFSPFDKKIIIDVKNIYDRDVNNTEWLLISVEDQGPGIKAEYMNKLFTKYTKFNAKPTGGESSTGLGLYIVKSLTDLLNGQVWCESVYEKGSTFYLKIPVYKQI